MSGLTRRSVAALLALQLAPLAALPAADAVEQPTVPRAWPWKSGTHKLMVDGVERTFVLDVPTQLKPGAALVMVFHGYGESPQAIRRYAGFTPLVEKYGFVAVYPQGTRDGDGYSCFNVGYDFQKNIKADDAKFARELAAQLVHDLDLDPFSVFATGCSNGGDMCYFLARQPKSFVNSIASVAGCMLVAWTNGFAPSTHTSVMEVHGTCDKTTPWEGDLANHDGCGAYLGTDAVMKLWVKGLSLEKSETTELSEGASPKQSKILLHRWWTTTDSAEMRLYEVQGGRHVWPKTWVTRTAPRLLRFGVSSSLTALGLIGIQK